MTRPHPALAVLATALSLAIARPSAAQSSSLTLTASPEAVAEFRKGWAAAEVLQTEPSLTHLKAALDRDPAFGLARVLYVVQGGVPAGQLNAELDRGVADAAKGSMSELLLAMAWRELAENRAARAATLFSAVNDVIPDDPFLAASAVGLGITDPKVVYGQMKDVAARFPSYGPIYNNIAYSAWAAGDHAAALAAAEKQVQLMHSSPNAHDSYAELLQWSGKLPEALHHYAEAAEMDTTFTEALIGMAEVETLQGHFDKARGYVRQAISRTHVQGAKATYLRDLAGISVMANDRKRAMTELEAVAAAAKADGDPRTEALAYAQLAASYGGMGDAKSAHAYADKARSAYAQPDMTISFFIAMAHAQMKHWEPANAALAAAKAATNSVPAPRLLAAEAYLLTAQGKPNDAIALLSKADLTDPLVAGRLAEAYAAAGNSAEAMKLTQQIQNDYALTLFDWPAANARMRAHDYMVASTKKR